MPRLRRAVVLTPWFESLSTAVLAVTASLLTVDGEPWSETSRVNIRVSLNVLGAAMGFEAALRLAAWGWRSYIRDPIERIDAVLVLLILADVLADARELQLSLYDFSAPRSTTMLRAFRCARLLLLWRGGRRVVSSLIRAAPNVMAVGAVFAVFLVSFAAIGMQIMGGKAREAVAAGCECPCRHLSLASPSLALLICVFLLAHINILLLHLPLPLPLSASCNLPLLLPVCSAAVVPTHQLRHIAVSPGGDIPGDR